MVPSHEIFKLGKFGLSVTGKIWCMSTEKALERAWVEGYRNE